MAVEKVFIDSVSKKGIEATEFELMLELIQTGDEVIILTLDHLARIIKKFVIESLPFIEKRLGCQLLMQNF
ncbi:hypothetical protein [Enterococcus sp. DIV0212c]|uniref:hypothetical protein n=1 Tax=Enterococcus sp. DIV0212c TaxID=2230867 RepID=UPI001AC59308|nr:hypothetical protein [Enterococcus sp. DIV0212c]